MERMDIMQTINDLIVEENGQPLTIEQKLSEACLDSLGTLVFLMELDAKFPVFKGLDDFEEIEKMGVADMTLKHLINLCKESITEAQ